MIDIVIVNWNSGNYLKSCLLSIFNYHMGKVSKVIIIDNASTDDSLLTAKAIINYDIELVIVMNKDNRGFGAACNQGFDLTAENYVLFLNPDAQLIDGTLEKSLDFMECSSNKNYQICGVRNINELGSETESAYNFPSALYFFGKALGLAEWFPGVFGLHKIPIENLIHDMDVDQVIGAYFFVRSKYFRDIGKFDERFFVYFEEVDYSYRVLLSGGKTRYLHAPKIIHVGGGSTSKVKQFRLYLSLKSRLLYGLKNFTALQNVLLFTATLLVEPVSRSIYAFYIDGISGFIEVLSAYKKLLMDMPVIFNTKS